MAYQKARTVTRSISRMVRHWPREERFSLTDQILRSSRSVGANLAESCGKQIYPKHFLAKLTDALQENSETQHWLQVALDEQYITVEHHDAYLNKTEEIEKLIKYMMKNPTKFRGNRLAKDYL